jgi:hypothetical protein
MAEKQFYYYFFSTAAGDAFIETSKSLSKNMKPERDKSANREKEKKWQKLKPFF